VSLDKALILNKNPMRRSDSVVLKEAALEAAVLPASNAIKQGDGVTITVQGSDGVESALGAT
jgi:hypothetical protein